MKIVNILNRKTLRSVCQNYCGKEIDFDKCNFNIGKPLKITYITGSYFTHENVEDIKDGDINTFQVITTNKIWEIEKLYEMKGIK